MDIYFDDPIIIDLNNKLSDYKSSLLESSLKILNQSISNYNRVILLNISNNDLAVRFNIDYSTNCIIDSFSLDNNLKYQLRNNNWNRFLDNEIYFNVKMSSEYKWHTPSYNENIISKRDIQFECENEFWSFEDNNKEYSRISNFECFEKKTISKLEYTKFRSTMNIFNFNAWAEYIIKLVKKNFPEYNLEEGVSKSIFRFVKLIKEDLYLGFEFDLNSLKKDFKFSNINLPEYFNIVVFNTNFKRTTKQKDYIYNRNNNILSLGILGNPFFYHPCYPLIVYSDMIKYTNKGYRSEVNYNYLTTFSNESSEFIEVNYPIEYGEKLKRHAFFYMNLLAYSSKCYLDYLENVLINSQIG